MATASPMNTTNERWEMGLMSDEDEHTIAQIPNRLIRSDAAWRVYELL